MSKDLFDKEPAFFPTVAAELFFEAEADEETPAFFDADLELDAELDAILATA